MSNLGMDSGNFKNQNIQQLTHQTTSDAPTPKSEFGLRANPGGAILYDAKL